MLTDRFGATATPFHPIVLRAAPPGSLLDALSLAAPGWPVAYAADGIPVETLATGFQIADAGIARVAEDSWEAAHWVLNAAIAEQRRG